MNRLIGFALAGMMTLLSGSAFARGMDGRARIDEIKMGHVAHFPALGREAWMHHELRREPRLHGPALALRPRQRLERDRFRTERRLERAHRR